MQKRRKTEADLLKELTDMTAKRGGLTETAKRLEISIQYLSDVVYGRRRISQTLAERLGYVRVVEYERRKV